ncbi:energy-coupling factor ABC transporter ATP-binding protein [Photobacterium nomapromontoriensis]|uniref:energy-coupling factor ABC transporter ATP-binding protein n=1 Tax=Photobacterium nomapromontoriensis TaxID=2910237 RepID=UPI003D1107C1
MSELIAVENLSYYRPNGQYCADDLSFSLFAGEQVAITGSNGSGKSTLLLLMMGLLPAQQGEVRLFGESCYQNKRFSEALFRRHRPRIGLVFQDPDDQLFCPTVIDDVSFGPLNQGLSAKTARQKAMQTLTQLGIADLADRVSYQLSGGQKRLVALATVLAMDPEVLILDEPTNDLDPDNQQRLIDILQQCQLPLILVSHDAAFRNQLTQRQYCLQDGTLTDISVSTESADCERRHCDIATEIETETVTDISITGARQ